MPGLKYPPPPSRDEQLKDDDGWGPLLEEGSSDLGSKTVEALDGGRFLSDAEQRRIAEQWKRGEDPLNPRA